MGNRQHLIGTNSTSYFAQRNYYSLPLKKYRFTKIWDKYRVLAEITFRLGQGKAHYRTCHNEDVLRHLTPGIKHYHLLNTVTNSKKTPWLVTFESSLPRYSPDQAKGVSLLLKDSCRYIIAPSANAYSIQQNVFEHFVKSGIDDAMRKMKIIVTSQHKILNSHDEKLLPNSYFHVCLVGNDLLLKGCREALSAVDYLVKQGRNIRLSVVGSMAPITYPFRSTPDMYQAVQYGLTKGFVSYYPSLPNQQVLALFQKSHISLFPSFADTFGYVVLESQACGTPVVSTNIRALPEINPLDAGWQIETQNNRFGNMLLGNVSLQKKASETITEGLIHYIQEAMDNPDMLAAKSARAIRHIAENHSVEEATETLEGLYDEISSSP